MRTVLRRLAGGSHPAYLSEPQFAAAPGVHVVGSTGQTAPSVEVLAAPQALVGDLKVGGVAFDVVVVADFRLGPKIVHRPAPSGPMGALSLAVSMDGQEMGVLVDQGVSELGLIPENDRAEADGARLVVSHARRHPKALPNDGRPKADRKCHAEVVKQTFRSVRKVE
jgi:hypothetical protein